MWQRKGMGTRDRRRITAPNRTRLSDMVGLGNPENLCLPQSTSALGVWELAAGSVLLCGILSWKSLLVRCHLIFSQEPGQGLHSPVYLSKLPRGLVGPAQGAGSLASLLLPCYSYSLGLIPVQILALPPTSSASLCASVSSSVKRIFYST